MSPAARNSGCPSPAPWPRSRRSTSSTTAFSALDFKTDAALRKALHQADRRESTVLIVAQRIGTIMHADQIVVLDEGKIVGIGTHQELTGQTCPVYQEIASSQLSEEELAI